MNKQMQDWINETMSGLDGAQRASAPPFLMTRIRAGLAKAPAQSAWESLYAFVSRPSVALAGILLVVTVNFLIILQKQNRQQQDVVNTQTEQVDVATQYNLINDIEYLAP